MGGVPDCDDTLSTCIDTMPVLCKFIRDHRMEEYEALAKHRHGLHGHSSVADTVATRYESRILPMQARGAKLLQENPSARGAFEKGNRAAALFNTLRHTGFGLGEAAVSDYVHFKKSPETNGVWKDLSALKGAVSALAFVEVLAAENRERIAAGGLAAYSLQDILTVSFMASNEAPLGGRLRERKSAPNRMGLRPPHGELLESVMEEFVAWLNSEAFQKDIPPVQAANMLVHMLTLAPTSEEVVTAHLMADLVLLSHGLPPVGLLKINTDQALDMGSPAVGHADVQPLALTIVDALTQPYIRLNELTRKRKRTTDEL